MTCELTVHRAPATLPQSATVNLFEVTGLVMIAGVLGRVTTAIQNQANNSSITALADAGGVGTTLGIGFSLSGEGVGALIGIPLAGNPYIATPLLTTPVLMGNGAVRLTCAASNTGETEWHLSYMPLEPGAKVTAV